MINLSVMLCLTPAHCWNCECPTNAASGGTTPSPGDYAVCANCLILGVFTLHLNVREPTAEEFCDVKAPYFLVHLFPQTVDTDISSS